MSNKRSRNGESKAMSTGTQTDNDHHDETSLDPIKQDWHIFRGPPDYTHVSLPYIWEAKHYAVGTSDAMNYADHTFRLTSPYDPFLSSFGTDLNPGTGVTRANVPASYGGDTKDKFGQTQFYEFYRGMYQYYSVIGCRYHVTVENLSAERLYVHFMHFNQELPPGKCSNQDMLLWKGTKSYLSTPHAQFFNNQVANAVELNADQIEDVDDMIMDTNNNPASATNAAIWAVSRNKNTAVIQHSAQYKPGDFRREIALDDEISTWTSVEANPAYPERLLVRVKTYDDNWHPDAGDTITRNKNIQYIIKVKIEYLTEFRELKAGLRYPTQRQPVSVVIATDNRTH